MKKVFSISFLAAMSIVYWATEQQQRRKAREKTTVTQRLLSWHAGQVHKHVQQR